MGARLHWSPVHGSSFSQPTLSLVPIDPSKPFISGMLPVRWMAPESLADGIFTPSSDIWSIGVLLYEIMTFGSFPYQGMSNKQVLEYVKNGNIISLPSHCSDEL